MLEAQRVEDFVVGDRFRRGDWRRRRYLLVGFVGEDGVDGRMQCWKGEREEFLRGVLREHGRDQGRECGFLERGVGVAR